MRKPFFLTFILMFFFKCGYSQEIETLEVYDYYCESSNPWELNYTTFDYQEDTLIIRNVDNSFCGPEELVAYVIIENDTTKIRVQNPSGLSLACDCSFGYTIKLPTGEFDTLNIQIDGEGFQVIIDEIITTTSEKIIEKFDFYPNPVEDVLTITGIKFQEVMIKDLSGKVLSTYSESKNHFDLSFLKSGVYILQLRSDGRIYSRKIIKK